MLLGELSETVGQWPTQSMIPPSVGVFASHALDIVTNPLHILYGKMNKFLNKGPAWNISKIPHYWVDKILLQPPDNDDAHGAEVEWLLKTLFDGLRTEEVGNSCQPNRT